MSFTQSVTNICLQILSPIFNNDSKGNDNDDQPPLFDPRRQTQTLFKVQLYVCSILGLFCFFTFCFLRYKFPILFTVRSYRNKNIKKLPNDMFSWIKILISINNEQLLKVIGLESYVFLCFFRMSIKILLSLSILGLCILSPVRYFITGSFDKDDPFNSLPFLSKYSINDGNDENSEPIIYLAISTFFTYIFTALIYYFLFKETDHIIKTRQKFLGSQRSLTDRTIFIKNIPIQMCNELNLKNHIQELNVGKVDQINFVYDYSNLVKLLERRDILINYLEILYSKSCGLNVNLFNSLDIQNVHLNIKELLTPPTISDIVYKPDDFELIDNNNDDNNNDDDKYYILATNNDINFNKSKRTCFKISKSTKSLIDSYSRELIKISDNVNQLKQQSDFKRLPMAFVTMDSVTDAQMAAQAVFSPKVFELITELAPAPLDVNWNNLLLENRTVFFRKNAIEFIILIFSCLLIIPIRYITSLLNVNSIRKIWKEFGDYLIKHDKVRTAVTGLLPTYLFSIINSVLPYVISLLSNFQGLGSKGDVELSVIKKNFLYIFFNLFLVFTLFGTLSSYKALLTDTTKIAPLLATSIKSLSLFYIDLILLQGLTMFPFKLLQIGDLSLFFWNFIINFKNRTPRLFKDYLYKPQIFDLGLILPQHILIFIITILYSSISTKILVSGLVYFILGFYTYKYQLVYSLVHPYHSTGKAWPIIFKRICLGVFFLHLQMFGSLALEQSFILAGLMLPLFPTTVVALMFFDRNYKPLLHYIALDAIKTRGKSVESENDNNNDIDNLLISTGFTQNTNNIKRKASVVSLENFLNGNNDCDAVLLDSSFGSSSKLPDNENVITDIDENSSNILENNNIVYTGSTNNVSNSTSESNIQTNPLVLKKTITHRKHSTIEEEREFTQSYVHPCLSEVFNNVMIGFGNNCIDYLNFKLKFEQNSESNYSDNNNNVAVQIMDMNSININDQDIEAQPGKVVGYVTRSHPVEEVF
ncbi:hypothetical protein C6P40_002146 [Pichia californica]|uniref:DUF221-domain-containing protein n=1 Tax=Pichia californica TaxID=460514 RepID=A0A9P6WI59_9ASCO|nr:hypothetical protein C6P42_001271 [[Candida] californica]KAG0687591.1 hypothetical protein C6P40_002146 [[Candida] californica]